VNVFMVAVDRAALRFAFEFMFRRRYRSSCFGTNLAEGIVVMYDLYDLLDVFHLTVLAVRIGLESQLGKV
jgi:hypothetical protein